MPLINEENGLGFLSIFSNKKPRSYFSFGNLTERERERENNFLKKNFTNFFGVLVLTFLSSQT